MDGFIWGLYFSPDRLKGKIMLQCGRGFLTSFFFFFFSSGLLVLVLICKAHCFPLAVPVNTLMRREAMWCSNSPAHQKSTSGLCRRLLPAVHKVCVKCDPEPWGSAHCFLVILPTVWRMNSNPLWWRTWVSPCEHCSVGMRRSCETGIVKGVERIVFFFFFPLSLYFYRDSTWFIRKDGFWLL